MRTNIVLDDDLTREAFALTGLKTKRELVEKALTDLVEAKRKSKRKSLCDAFETLQSLNLSDSPFPNVKRQNRANPFADQL